MALGDAVSKLPLGTQRNLGATLEVSGGMHILDTNPQCAACALVGGK